MKCLKPQNDVMGQALMDYHRGFVGGQLLVKTSVAEDEPYDIAYFFRDFEDMPPLEQKALELADGHILDVGAGTGIHSLALQKMDKKVRAIDISELSVDVMKKRGVMEASCQDFFALKDTKFDTILFLMNGIGLVETLDGFQKFFGHCRSLLNPNGQILFDSSDIIYLFEDEDGSYLINLNDKYYGEVDFQVSYNNKDGEAFPWLFIDFDNIQYLAEQNGFRAELIQKGEHFDYLARLTIKS